MCTHVPVRGSSAGHGEGALSSEPVPGTLVRQHPGRTTALLPRGAFHTRGRVRGNVAGPPARARTRGLTRALHKSRGPQWQPDVRFPPGARWPLIRASVHFSNSCYPASCPFWSFPWMGKGAEDTGISCRTGCSHFPQVGGSGGWSGLCRDAGVSWTAPRTVLIPPGPGRAPAPPAGWCRPGPGAVLHAPFLPPAWLGSRSPQSLSLPVLMAESQLA